MTPRLRETPSRQHRARERLHRASVQLPAAPPGRLREELPRGRSAAGKGAGAGTHPHLPVRAALCRPQARSRLRSAAAGTLERASAHAELSPVSHCKIHDGAQVTRRGCVSISLREAA